MVASIGRFFIGLGTAFAYIGVLKIASLWLPANRFATVAGLTTAFGMASAIFSDLYLTEIVQHLGYKDSLFSALWLGIALSVFILFFMRNKPRAELSQPGTLQKPMSFIQLLISVKTVISNPQMWLIGLIGGLYFICLRLCSLIFGAFPS